MILSASVPIVTLNPHGVAAHWAHVYKSSEMLRIESCDLVYDDSSVGQRRGAHVALMDGWKKVYWMRFNYVNV